MSVENNEGIIGTTWKSRAVTDDDRNSICYFIQEKGDITRWSGWEERKADIEAEYPHLITALKDLAYAKKFLKLIVEMIGNDIEKE